MRNSLLKYLLGPLSALPYHALSVTDTVNGDKMVCFVHLNARSHVTCWLGSASLWKVLILSARVIELLNCCRSKGADKEAERCEESARKNRGTWSFC